MIEELIHLAQDMREPNARGEKLGLPEHELAFYDALGTNDRRSATTSPSTGPYGKTSALGCGTGAPDPEQARLHTRQAGGGAVGNVDRCLK